MAKRIECPMCGHYNKRSQDFCPACGTRVNKSAVSVEVDNLAANAPASQEAKRRNSALVIASIVYLIALFIPIVNLPVNTGRFLASPVKLALMSFSAIAGSTDLLVILVSILAVVATVITVAYVIFSIKNAYNYKKGKKTLFSQNVFCLVTIPAIYLLIVLILGMAYDAVIVGLLNVGFFVTLLTGIISTIYLAVISVDKNRVSKKSIAVAVIAVICFVAIFACMFQPIFGISVMGGRKNVFGFEFSAKNLRNFYDSAFLENHYLNIAVNGPEKVIADAEYRLQNSDHKGEALATIIMTVLPATIPMIMIVSIVAIIISSSAILSSLLAKLCTLNEKKAYLLIAKLLLIASSISFIWAFVQLIIAIYKVGFMLISVSNLSFSVMIYPIVALLAAVVLLLLNIKEKNHDYIVVNQYE